MAEDPDMTRSGPVSPSVLRQQRLLEEFLFIDDWNGRYQHLIDLGLRLPSMPPGMRTEHNRLQKCDGETFLAGERRNEFLLLHASSDRPIVAGILALTFELYSGLEPAEILRHPPSFLDRIGLTRRLSPHRRIALLAVHERLIALASDGQILRKLAS